MSVIYNGINFTDSGNKLTVDIVRAMESFFGGKLPRDYENFLVQINGGIPLKRNFNAGDGSTSSRIGCFLGITERKSMNIINSYRGRIIPENMLAIAEASCGDLVLISVKTNDRGKIYLWDHEKEADVDNGEIPNYDNLTLVANSFDEFLSKLYSEDADKCR